MHIKLLISAAAIALVAGLGTVSAAEQYETLGGQNAVQLSQQEMAEMRGEGFIGVPGGNPAGVQADLANAMNNIRLTTPQQSGNPLPLIPLNPEFGLTTAGAAGAP